MASLGHVALGLLGARALCPQSRSRSAWPLVFCGLSLLPDADYLAIALGAPDVGPFGHRGASHSLVTPVIVALAALALAPRFRLPRWRLSLLAGLVVGSHLLLDAMTTSSRGMPLLWPFEFSRFAMPWRPIPNAPSGLEFFSALGLRVAWIELIQFLPFLMIAFWPGRKTVPTSAATALGPVAMTTAGTNAP